MKTMEWRQLLKGARLGEPEANPSKDRTEFEEDYDKIIFSSAFRRLQDKAQVFPLSRSDYVRTRLTHSLEVSSVGRALGTMAGKGLKGILPEWILPSDLGAIVAAACLAHDIGNPPFGHSGEFAIRQWFKESRILNKLRSRLSEWERLDIANYEGNAQGFRVVASLQRQGLGLHLTHATLAAMTKYPCASTCLNRKNRLKKFGFFQSESQLFEEVARKTGLLGDRRIQQYWCRHPLAFLVEAADDICNPIMDLQDSARVGILPYAWVADKFRGMLAKDKSDSYTESELKHEVEENGCALLKKLSREIIEYFLGNEEEIRAGKLFNPLAECLGDSSNDLINIRETLKAKVFTSREVVEIEAPAFRVLGGLLDVFVAANEDYAKGPRASRHTQLIMNFVPLEFRGPKANEYPQLTPYLRLLSILDFVSGMTDSYAVSLYRIITGMSLPAK